MSETFNPGFPVYIYEEGMELPNKGIYYLVSGNGLWLHKDTGIVNAFVPVDNISVLQELDSKTMLSMNMPKLPARHVYKIKKFFQEVVDKHQAESNTILYYNKNTGDFKVQITEQVVSHGGVNYKRIGLSHTEEMKDYLRVGTIHSHCDFGAFHSGTDVGDEEDFDGLHCTFGHNNKEEFTISASIVVNGHRLKVDPMTVLEGIDPVEKEKEDDFFSLKEPDQKVVEEWAAEKDGWMSHVQGQNGFGFFSKPFSDGIEIGENVSWVGDLKYNNLKETMGDGPFEVVNRDKNKLTVKTNIGLAQLSVNLFKKEQ